METETTHAKEKNKGGRPPNSMNVMSRAAREAAAATGKLPHEILLDIARGNPQTLRIPDKDTGAITEKLVGVTLEQVTDAAKAAAPYYAPKISTVEVISGVSDDDLDAIIASAAAQAGVSIGPGGEGQEGEDQAPAHHPPRRRVKLLG